ncbi:MAG: DUF3788 family protein, partial [Bacteroidales bacterium]|nr:DUF3788 family protein [Bacteroidales bacterium]
HAEFSMEWRYYNDGKSWLYRGLKKDKVIFWVAVFQDAFNVHLLFKQKSRGTDRKKRSANQNETGF